MTTIAPGRAWLVLAAIVVSVGCGFAQEPTGGGLRLGKTGHVTCGDLFSVKRGTIEFWFKPATMANNEWVMAKRKDARNGFTIGFGPGSFMWQVENSGEWAYTGVKTAAIAPDVWHHAAFDFDGTRMTFYLDGVPYPHATRPGDFSVAHLSGGELVIGQGRAHTEYYNGRVDEIRLSDCSRYRGEFAPPKRPSDPDANTVALWHCDGSGAQLVDSSGRGNHGTIVGKVERVPDNPFHPVLGSRAKRFTMPRVERGPTLTGSLSDPIWKDAARLDGFVDAQGRPLGEAGTEVYALCDETHLYVGFLCREPKTASLVSTISQRDGPLWRDDCVEFFLDVLNGRTWSYHFIVNPRGSFWDGLHLPKGVKSDYNSETTCRCAVLEDRWIAEMKVPFEDLGGAPQAGEVWGVNFCRERRADGVELSSWSQAVGGFPNPGSFGDAVFEPAPEAKISVLSRGAVWTDAPARETNRFLIQVTNGGPAAATVAAEVFCEDESVARRVVEAAPGKSAWLAVPYSVPEEGQPVFDFSVHLDGNEVYRSRRQALAPLPRGPRVWQIKAPLFKELLSDEPPGLRRVGSILWAHAFEEGLLRETAKRLATRYVAEDMYRECQVRGLITITSRTHVDRPDLFARYELRTIAEPPVRAPGAPWILDPRSTEYYLEEAERYCQPPGEMEWAPWGIYAGDEVEHAALGEGAQLMANPGDYAYIRQADEEVTRDHGGGKWGIPAGIHEHDPSPYKWIAYRRWCNAKFRERHRRLREIVRTYHPQMRIVSTDPPGGYHPNEWSTQAPLFDIVTHQVGFAGGANPWRAQFGCLSKLLSDLTGKESWPCAHVENYGMDTRPEEVVEVLSQVFRNGGAGLHLYLPDTGNAGEIVGDTRVCYFGSPRRYHTIMNIVSLARTMPRPQYPDYERTAIFYNEDTLASRPYDAVRPYDDQLETCYTMLGPVAGSWFRFIDCALLLSGPALNERFDLIYLPMARYQRAEVVARLREFAKAGGTLVCADPLAFETDLLGNDTQREREAIFGVVTGGRLEAKKLIPESPLTRRELALPGPAHTLRLGPDAATLARYEDGSTAISSHRLGKGRAVLFGSNPLALAAVRDTAWRGFFTEWVAQTGAPTGLDIWRFQLPMSLVWKEPPPPGVCLTNNHLVWQEERPRPLYNRNVGGGYRYSLAPDAMPDVEAADRDIPFARGRLTDRRTSCVARKAEPRGYAKYELPADRWMVSWARNEPVEILFDLRQTRKPVELRLWFCESLPALAVEGSLHGKEWKRLGEGPAQEAGADVYDAHVSLPGTPCRYVRLHFAARQAGHRLSLVETEVWGGEI